MDNVRNEYLDTEEAMKMLAVVIKDLPEEGVKFGADLYMHGKCILVDLANDVRGEAEELPVEIFGRVTEHWGVRTEDGYIGVFVLKLDRTELVDRNATPQMTGRPSMLSLLMQKGANLVVMYDKLYGIGCVCGVFSGSRHSGAMTTLVRPEPFSKYDPFGDSVVETHFTGKRLGEAMRAIRQIAAGKLEAQNQNAGNGGFVTHVIPMPWAMSVGGNETEPAGTGSGGVEGQEPEEPVGAGVPGGTQFEVETASEESKPEGFNPAGSVPEEEPVKSEGAAGTGGTGLSQDKINKLLEGADSGNKGGGETKPATTPEEKNGGEKRGRKHF